VPDEIPGGAKADGRRSRAPLEWPAGTVEKLCLALRVHAHAAASLVKQSVMAAAQEHEVRQLGLAAVCPVLDVMGVAVLQGAPGKTAALVPELQGAPDGRRDGAGLAADAEDLSVPADHPHRCGLAREAPGRFRGNADVRIAEPGAVWARVGRRRFRRSASLARFSGNARRFG